MFSNFVSIKFPIFLVFGKKIIFHLNHSCLLYFELYFDWRFRSTIICYQLTCYQLICYQPHLLSPHFLSTHLLSNSFAINSVAITFICYQASFAIRPQLLSTHLLSSLTCYQANLLWILSCNQQFCYQSSFAINNFAINHNLLSNFRLPLNPYFYHFFLLKIWKKGKISRHLEFSFAGKLCVGMEPAHFVASSKHFERY